MKATTSTVLAALATAAAAQSNCKQVSFTVSGTAQNKNITGISVTSLANLTAFYNSAPFITVSGSQTLVGQYCTPTVKNANNDKLEVEFQSIVTDLGSWSAQGGVGTDFAPFQPNLYSWNQYANAQGYPTLAIDRLGTGRSSHPDPLLVVQAAYEIELYADLANQLRAGKTQVGRAYNNLAYVGNSYGSQLGAGVAGRHPNAYNSFLLTGYSNNPQQDFVGVSLVLPLPAAVVDPARFGTLPPGYVTSSSEVGRTNSFFGSHAQVDFDDAVSHQFFVRKDVVSLGQFVSVYAFPFDGTGFKGRVLVLNGEQDQAFCGPGSPVLGPASCSAEGQPAASKVVFPNAVYNYKTVNKIGHAVQLHLRSQVLFKIAHQWLGGAAFLGGAPA